MPKELQVSMEQTDEERERAQVHMVVYFKRDLKSFGFKNVYLKCLEPMPPVCGILDIKKLNDSYKHFGLVIWQHTSNQTVLVVQVDMEPEIQTQMKNIQHIPAEHLPRYASEHCISDKNIQLKNSRQ